MTAALFASVAAVALSATPVDAGENQNRRDHNERQDRQDRNDRNDRQDRDNRQEKDDRDDRSDRDDGNFYHDGNRTVIEIDQVKLGSVWADLDVDISRDAKKITSTSTAVGNTGAGLISEGDIQVDIKQRQDGLVAADNYVNTRSAQKVIGVTTAYGNAATGGTWDGNTNYRVDQKSKGEIDALTKVDINRVGRIDTSTTAIANVSVPFSENGDNRAFQTQKSDSDVKAETIADLDRTRKPSSFVTNAGGNAVSATGSTTTAIVGAVQTTEAGNRILAKTDVEIERAKDVLAMSSAFGNSITLDNKWGYTSLGREGSEVFQGNDSRVAAETFVTLDNWAGTATSSAYGVGNTASVSNVGSDTALFSRQNNYGGVSAYASLDGKSGNKDKAIVNSTAIGNAASATLCDVCGDAALYGRTEQFNAGQVTAQGVATFGQAGHVFGTATAVGNSSTFQKTSGD